MARRSLLQYEQFFSARPAGAAPSFEVRERDFMDVRVSTRDVAQFDGDAVAVGVFSDDDSLQGPAAALDEAMRIKPARHHFEINRPGAEPALPRHMSMTGG